MQRHFLSNMSEIPFNFELNCFVKDTDKTRLLYALSVKFFPRNLRSFFFIVLGNLGKKLRNLLVEIGMHSSNCITVAAQDNRLEKWSNFNKSLNVQFS